MFEDLVSVFASQPPFEIPTPDLGDEYVNSAWRWMAMVIAAMREIDYDYTKGMCYDILSRLAKEPGGPEAVDDVCNITRCGLIVLVKRLEANLN